MRANARLLQLFISFVLVLLPSLVFAQAKPLRELKVGYPLGGSASYFWVAHKSGSFEKHGIKVEPIYIRGGLDGNPGGNFRRPVVTIARRVDGGRRLGTGREGVAVYRRGR